MTLDHGENALDGAGPVQAAVERALSKQRTDATREVEAILDAALRTVERAAPAAPRVADIVAEAKISNQAFYRYFAGKDDLMRALLERGISRLYTYLEHQTAKASSGPAQIEAWIRGVLAQVIDRRAARQSAAVHRQLPGDAVHDDPRTAELLIDPLHRCGSPNPELDATAIYQTVFGTMRRYLHSPNPPSAADCDHLVQFCLRAVTGPLESDPAEYTDSGAPDGAARAVDSSAAAVTGRPHWLNLAGGANARDLGDLPTADGRRTRAGVLIRSANLQHLTDGDRRHLVSDLGVRRIVDLRSDVEVYKEGPGPLTGSPDVVIHHLSLLPDRKKVRDDQVAVSPGSATPSAAPETNVLFPERDKTAPTAPTAPELTDDPMANGYLGVLDGRTDSVVAALRAIAEPEGATIVHCAAGKDRTGMIVAIALTLSGVDRGAVVADFAASDERIADINALLGTTSTYRREMSNGGMTAPKAHVIERVLDALESRPGGLRGWLAAHGWRDDDTARLRARLVG